MSTYRFTEVETGRQWRCGRRADDSDPRFIPAPFDPILQVKGELRRNGSSYTLLMEPAATSTGHPRWFARDAESRRLYRLIRA